MGKRRADWRSEQPAWLAPVGSVKTEGSPQPAAPEPPEGREEPLVSVQERRVQQVWPDRLVWPERRVGLPGPVPVAQRAVT
jgi:hypothetical protein